MPRKTDSNNPADWLLFAASDLEGIRCLAQAELSYVLCRSKLAEVLEKILKAELIRQGWFLIKTHDVEVRRKELHAYDPSLAQNLTQLCAELDEVYFIDRYPGFDLEDEDWPALREQVAEVDRLFAAVQARL